ncbi:hypothetical protein CDAR_494791 [Caerostris darwini]|uniref:Uncharacterized protein n=1 Tax=Caerostris darwini TaxID=1538125 RepID=A0AAV4MII6_9ARAC|nr:hypothetical protein CDAR_494791 [Caerostris darwini]
MAPHRLFLRRQTRHSLPPLFSPCFSHSWDETHSRETVWGGDGGETRASIPEPGQGGGTFLTRRCPVLSHRRSPQDDKKKPAGTALASQEENRRAHPPRRPIRDQEMAKEFRQKRK